MHLYYTSFILPALSIVLALRSVIDKPSSSHLLDDLTFITANPASLETKERLPEGIIYANAYTSLLFEKLVPIEMDQNLSILERPGGPEVHDMLKARDIDDLMEAWIDQSPVTLFSNRTARFFSYEFDIFEKLHEKRKKGSEISHAGTAPRDHPGGLAQHKRILGSSVLPKTKSLAGRSVDKRVEICNSWGYPYRATGFLETAAQLCTGKPLPKGVLISPRHVITSGNCIYDGEEKDWMIPGEFTISLRNGSCSDPKYYLERFKIKQLWTSVGWLTQGLSNHDWAIVELATPSTNLGWMSFGWGRKMFSHSGDFNMNGYSQRGDFIMKDDSKTNDFDIKADYPNYGTMWNTFGSIKRHHEDYFTIPMATVEGDTGASLYGFYPDEDSRVIYGVLTASSPRTRLLRKARAKLRRNVVTRITEPKFLVICEIMRLSLSEDEWVC